MPELLEKTFGFALILLLLAGCGQPNTGIHRTPTAAPPSGSQQVAQASDTVKSAGWSSASLADTGLVSATIILP